MKLIIGPPGGGKTEIVRWLIQEFNMVHINLGMILQDEARIDPTIYNIINNGENPPFHLILLLFEKTIENHIKNGVKLSQIILENYPYTLELAKHLDPMKYKIEHVIWCEIRLKDVIYRICKRDLKRNLDTDLIAKTRYNYWLKHAMPIKEYYERMGLLRKINIEQPRFEIRRLIRQEVFNISAEKMPDRTREKYIKVYFNNTESDSEKPQRDIVNLDSKRDYDNSNL